MAKGDKFQTYPKLLEESTFLSNTRNEGKPVFILQRPVRALTYLLKK